MTLQDVAALVEIITFVGMVFKIIWKKHAPTIRKALRYVFKQIISLLSSLMHRLEETNNEDNPTNEWCDGRSSLSVKTYLTIQRTSARYRPVWGGFFSLSLSLPIGTCASERNRQRYVFLHSVTEWLRPRSRIWDLWR